MIDKSKKGQKTKKIKREERHKIVAIDHIHQVIRDINDDRLKSMLEKAILEVKKI